MKRRIHQNIWGNWNGYEGNRKVESFGTDEEAALLWLGGTSMSRRIRKTIYLYGGGFTKVHDIDEAGDIIEGETRTFEDGEQALRYARDRVPVGEAFVVVGPHCIVDLFGSKPALRNGGWL